MAGINFSRKKTADLLTHLSALEIVNVMTAVAAYHFGVCLFCKFLFVFDPAGGDLLAV